MTLIIDPDNLDRVSVVITTTGGTLEIELVTGATLTTDGVTLQALYSFLKEEWKEDNDLIKFPFPMIAITEEKFELQNGWDFKNTASKDLIRIGGWALKSENGTTTEQEYACIMTLGVIGGTDQVYYLQSSGGTIPVDFVLEGVVDQAVLIYQDLPGGTFDYRDYFKLFVREYAKTYSSATLTDIGVTLMTYQVYRFPLANASDLKVIATDTVVNTTEPYTNMSITWLTSGTVISGLVGGNGTFSVYIDGAEEDATAEQIYTYVQYQLRRDADIDTGGGTIKGKVANELLYFIGDVLYTRLYSSGKGTFIDDYMAVDETRLYFRDDANVLRNFPFKAVLTLQFGDNLVNDTLSKFWVFFTDSITPPGYDYGTENAILVDDAESADMVGLIDGEESIAKQYAFDTNAQRGNTFPPGWETEEIPITVVALGIETAQFVKATGTVKRTLTNVVSLVAALERNYKT